MSGLEVNKARRRIQVLAAAPAGTEQQQSSRVKTQGLKGKRLGRHHPNTIGVIGVNVSRELIQ